MGRARGVNFKPGSFYRADERSGFTARAERTREEWTGSIVETRFWEPRQPQDFVHGVPDDQSVPNPRSEPPPVWDGPIATNLTANVTIGAMFLPLLSTFGFSDGDSIGVMLDNGEVFNTTQDGNPTGGGINIMGPMPYTAASGNDVTDYEAAGP